VHGMASSSRSGRFSVSRSRSVAQRRWQDASRRCVARRRAAATGSSGCSRRRPSSRTPRSNALVSCARVPRRSACWPAAWPTGRSSSIPAPTRGRWCPRSKNCPALATGRPSTSRCARSESPTRSRTAIWSCGAWPATARRVSSNAGRSRGVRGARMRSCCCGRAPETATRHHHGEW